MSVSYNVYVGPFLICKTAKDKLFIEKEKTLHACNNDKCKLYKKNVQSIITSLVGVPAFCVRCGASIQQITEKYKVPSFYANDMIEKVDQKFFVAEIKIDDKNKDITNIFIPNIKIDGLERNFFFNTQPESSCNIIEDGQATYEKDVFKNIFQGEITIFKYYYETVIISWGVINYYI